MKVLKFGGTSVGTPESLRSVKNIVESCDERVIVVVSALGGITDRLIATAREAEKGSPAYQDGHNDPTSKSKHGAYAEGSGFECLLYGIEA